MIEIEEDQFPEIYFDEMTSVDIAQAGGKAEHWIAILPVAATEQHGPHLPIGTDSMINEGLIARFAEERAKPYPVSFLPVQKIAKSDEHSSFPGTLTLDAETALSTWSQIGQCLISCGIRRIIILNSHGGNSALVDQLCLQMRHLGALCVGTSWSRLMDIDGAASDIVGEEEKALGIHGGDIETSIMLSLRPELVRLEEAQDFYSEQADFKDTNQVLHAYGRHQFGWLMQDLNRYGVVGNAAAASSEKGDALIKAALDGFEKLLIDVSQFDLDRFS